jgi:hypothetical protein
MADKENTTDQQVSPLEQRVEQKCGGKACAAEEFSGSPARNSENSATPPATHATTPKVQKAGETIPSTPEEDKDREKRKRATNAELEVVAWASGSIPIDPALEQAAVYTKSLAPSWEQATLMRDADDDITLHFLKSGMRHVKWEQLQAVSLMNADDAEELDGPPLRSDGKVVVVKFNPPHAPWFFFGAAAELKSFFEKPHEDGSSSSDDEPPKKKVQYGSGKKIE